MTLYRLLHRVAGTTQRFQRRTINVTDTHQIVNTSIENIQLLRENVDFLSNFQTMVCMADQLKVEPNVPRVA